VYYRYVETNYKSKNAILTTLADLTVTTLSATVMECDRPRRDLHDSQETFFDTEMPTSSNSNLNTAAPSVTQISSDQTSLNELMLLSHLREYEHRVEHLEHEVYVDNLLSQSCRKVKVKLAQEILR
jgi:hypothetical protein